MRRQLQSRIFRYGAFAVLLLASFQNCSQVSFAPSPDALDANLSLSSSAPVDTGTMIINKGAPYTKNQNLEVEILVKQPVTEMILQSNECPDPKGPDWTEYKQKSEHILLADDGRHEVFARVRNALGIVSNCFKAGVELDRKAPVAQFIRIPDKLTRSTAAEIGFSVNDEGSGVENYFCRFTGQNTFTRCDPFLYFSNLTEGGKTFNFYAVDRAGNQSETLEHTWFIDNTRPVVNIVAPLIVSPLKQKSATIHFTASDGNGSGIKGFRCSMNGVNVANCSSPQTFNNLADGTYNFSVVAIDKVDLESNPAASQTFVVDTYVAPPPPATPAGSFKILGVTGGGDSKVDQYLTANAAPTVHFESSSAAQGYVLQLFSDSTNQSVCGPYNVAANLTTYTATNCAGLAGNARYIIRMKSIKDGLETLASDLKFTKDFAGPIIQITKVTKQDDLKKAKIEFSIMDFSGIEAATCFKKFGSDVKEENCLNKTSIEYTNLIEGQHDFTIQAKDKAGNSSTSNVVSFTMDYVVCDPFRLVEGRCQKGLKANLYYLPSDLVVGIDEPSSKIMSVRYQSYNDVVRVAKKSKAILYLPSLDVRARSFTEGFTVSGGNQLKNDNGEILSYWFAFDMDTILKLGPNDQDGYYQVVIVSDDGSILSVNNEVLINNDKNQSSTLGCAAQSKVLTMNKSTRLPANIRYYQGPPTQISASIFWRRVSSPSAPLSQYCANDKRNGTGNAWGFALDKEGTGYQKLLDEGFTPLVEENFIVDEAI